MQATSSDDFVFRVRSWKYRMVNRLGSKLAGEISLAEDELLAEACRITQLTDFGDDDFRGPLGVLLDSFEEDARLNYIGRILTRKELIQKLTKRLRMQDDFRRYPEILEVPIRRPIIIAGLARTGTTFLHRLLAQDPDTRSFQFWELLFPSPSPDFRSYETDPRRKSVQRGITIWNWLILSKREYNQLRRIHNINYNSPEECWPLFQNTFLSNTFSVYARLKAYREWLEDQDMYGAYRYYRKQLQLLLWRYSAKRLILKNTSHLKYLDVLIRVFPDALVVWTHRDPLKTIPSSCSLLALARQTRSDQIDLNELGNDVLNSAGSMINRGMKVRESSDPTRFLDVDYYAMIKDPISEVRRIYEYFGEDLSDRALNRMRAWLAENSRNKYGIHRYNLESFGLDSSEVNRRFETYRERFSVPFE